jgi:uncharacterized membrane protein
MEDIIKTIAHHTALFLEGIAVIFIITGAIGALYIYIKKTLFIKTDYHAIAQSRSHLGHSLSLSLEFLIGADILKTAISPTWQDIGQLAAIVGIRTMLNFFLMKELKEMGEDQKPVENN